MLKLLYIATNLNTSGGVARVLSVKQNYLINVYGYNIHIINTHGDTSKLFFHFHDSITIHHLERKERKLLNLVDYKTKLNKKIDAINPDIIINCDNGLKGSLLPFLLKKSTIPLVYENHNSKNARAASIVDNIKLKLSFFLFNMGASRYSQIIVYRLPKRRRKTKNFKVIPNPIGFETNNINISLENNIVIAVGRFSYQKGYDTLIKIWSLVSKRQPGWVLKIYGAGDYKDLLELTQKLNIESTVQFLSPVKNIRDVYLSGSMLLNTSRYEPFGLAVTEAMACGVPVVAFENTQGPKSYIEDKQNGYLIKKDDLEGYANTIHMLMENKNEMQRISRAAKESMETYNLAKIMKVWHEMFQSLKIPN